MEQLRVVTNQGSEIVLPGDVVAAFKAGLRGQMLLAGDDGYEQARRVWNGMIDRRPALIVRCSGPADVIATVNFARIHGLLLAIKSGGHNVAGSGTCDGGVVIDLSLMRAVRVDAAAATARVQGGATLGDIDRETQVFGLWAMNRPYHHVSGFGAAGMGAFLGVAVGAALAHRAHGRIAVNIQSDGDLMYAPGALWTAAHHRIPLLTVMHNNRAYHQELMHIQRMANRHERGITRCSIGTTIENPHIDYCKIAQGMGVWAEGPITRPDDLGPALRRALNVVKRGEPALLDVITQPR